MALTVSASSEPVFICIHCKANQSSVVHSNTALGFAVYLLKCLSRGKSTIRRIVIAVSALLRETKFVRFHITVCDVGLYGRCAADCVKWTGFSASLIIGHIRCLTGRSAFTIVTSCSNFMAVLWRPRARTAGRSDGRETSINDKRHERIVSSTCVVVAGVFMDVDDALSAHRVSAVLDAYV